MRYKNCCETSVVMDPAYVVAQSDIVWDISRL